MDVMTVALLTLAAGFAGFIDAIAGGGGLITLPALLLAGVPPAEAIATNKLQGTFGVAAASGRYYRAGAIDVDKLRIPVVATALGAALGAGLVTRLDPLFVRALVPYALFAAAAYFAAFPYLRQHVAHITLSGPAFALGLAAPIGFYDGIFGPGAGSLYTLAFLAFTGASILNATAHAKVLNMTSNVISLSVFLVLGQVNFQAGLPMALGQAMGAWAGAHTALKHGAAVIRPLLVVATVAIAAKLLLTT